MRYCFSNSLECSGVDPCAACFQQIQQAVLPAVAYQLQYQSQQQFAALMNAYITARVRLRQAVVQGPLQAQVRAVDVRALLAILELTQRGGGELAPEIRVNPAGVPMQPPSAEWPPSPHPGFMQSPAQTPQVPPYGGYPSGQLQRPPSQQTAAPPVDPLAGIYARLGQTPQGHAQLEMAVPPEALAQLMQIGALGGMQPMMGGFGPPMQPPGQVIDVPAQPAQEQLTTAGADPDDEVLIARRPKAPVAPPPTTVPEQRIMSLTEEPVTVDELMAAAAPVVEEPTPVIDPNRVVLGSVMGPGFVAPNGKPLVK